MPNKAFIGVDQVHYALLTSDTSVAALWAAAVALPLATEVGVNPNGAIATLFADNGPAVTANSIGEIDISLKTADVDPVNRAIILGHSRSGGVTSYKGADTSPDLAIGFRTKLSDGNYGYVWVLKGKMMEGQETFTTQQGNITFMESVLAGKFTILNYNGEWKRTTRADDPDYVAATGVNWFTNGPLGTADTIAPTATSVPLDAAVGVAVDANIVITFDEAIQVSDITAANFVLMDNIGTNVPGALTYDAAHEVVTFNPTSNLAAATAHTFIVTTGVRDLAGNALAAPLIINFTTS